MILFRAHVAARTYSGPGGELARRGEGLRIYPHFRDHLLRGLHAKSGYFRQPGHRLRMLLQRGRAHLAELTDLLVQQLQSFQMQFQQLQMARLRRAAQGVG